MICPNCNSEIPDGSTFCGYCGTRIEIAGNNAEQVNASVDHTDVSQPVSDAVEQAASYADVSQPVSDAVEQAVSDAAEQAASSFGIPQPVSDPAAQAGSFSGIPQPVQNNSSGDFSGGSSAFNTAAAQVMQPNMAADTASAVGQADTIGKKPFDIASLLKNKLVLICAGALVVLVVLIILIAGVAGSGSTKSAKKGTYILSYADGEGVVIYNGAVVKGTDLSYYANELAESTDGTKMLVYDDSGLILFDNGKPYDITDELYRSKAQLSDSGAVAFISDESLYIYQGPGSKPKEIAELDDPDYCSFAISPDGKTVVFSEYDYYEEKYSYLSAWNNGKIIDFDDKFTPYCVSNGGKLICGRDSKNKFAYIKNMKGSAVKLKTTSRIYPVSADHSKVMFYSDGTTYYFDSTLKEEVKVSNKSFDFFLPEGQAYPSNIKSFYVLVDNSIRHFYYKSGAYESDTIVSSASNPVLSADEKTIIYQHKDELIKISVSNPDKEVTIADDVADYYYYKSFACDPSLKFVYYINDDDELFYVAGKNSKRIVDDVDECYVNDKGVCVIITYDGDLFYSSKGGEKKKVTGVSDEAEGLMIYGNLFYAATDDTVYVSTDGMTFKKCLDL